MTGSSQKTLPYVLAENIPAREDGRSQFIPVVRNGGRAVPLTGHDSGSLYYLRHANGFTIAPPAGIARGTK